MLSTGFGYQAMKGSMSTKKSSAVTLPRNVTSIHCRLLIVSVLEGREVSWRLYHCSMANTIQELYMYSLIEANGIDHFSLIVVIIDFQYHKFIPMLFPFVIHVQASVVQ